MELDHGRAQFGSYKVPFSGYSQAHMQVPDQGPRLFTSRIAFSEIGEISYRPGYQYPQRWTSPGIWEPVLPAFSSYMIDDGLVMARRIPGCFTPAPCVFPCTTATPDGQAHLAGIMAYDRPVYLLPRQDPFQENMIDLYELDDYIYSILGENFMAPLFHNYPIFPFPPPPPRLHSHYIPSPPRLSLTPRTSHGAASLPSTKRTSSSGAPSPAPSTAPLTPRSSSSSSSSNGGTPRSATSLPAAIFSPALTDLHVVPLARALSVPAPVSAPDGASQHEPPFAKPVATREFSDNGTASKLQPATAAKEPKVLAATAAEEPKVPAATAVEEPKVLAATAVEEPKVPAATAAEESKVEPPTALEESKVPAAAQSPEPSEESKEAGTATLPPSPGLPVMSEADEKESVRQLGARLMREGGVNAVLSHLQADRAEFVSRMQLTKAVPSECGLLEDSLDAPAELQQPCNGVPAAHRGADPTTPGAPGARPDVADILRQCRALRAAVPALRQQMKAACEQLAREMAEDQELFARPLPDISSFRTMARKTHRSGQVVPPTSSAATTSTSTSSANPAPPRPCSMTSVTADASLPTVFHSATTIPTDKPSTTITPNKATAANTIFDHEKPIIKNPDCIATLAVSKGQPANAPMSKVPINAQDLRPQGGCVGTLPQDPTALHPQPQATLAAAVGGWGQQVDTREDTVAAMVPVQPANMEGGAESKVSGTAGSKVQPGGEGREATATPAPPAFGRMEAGSGQQRRSVLDRLTRRASVPEPVQPTTLVPASHAALAPASKQPSILTDSGVIKPNPALEAFNKDRDYLKSLKHEFDMFERSKHRIAQKDNLPGLGPEPNYLSLKDMFQTVIVESYKLMETLTERNQNISHLLRGNAHQGGRRPQGVATQAFAAASVEDCVYVIPEIDRSTPVRVDVHILGDLVSWQWFETLLRRQMKRGSRHFIAAGWNIDKSSNRIGVIITAVPAKQLRTLCYATITYAQLPGCKYEKPIWRFQKTKQEEEDDALVAARPFSRVGASKLAGPAPVQGGQQQPQPQRVSVFDRLGPRRSAPQPAPGSDQRTAAPAVTTAGRHSSPCRPATSAPTTAGAQHKGRHGRR